MMIVDKDCWERGCACHDTWKEGITVTKGIPSTENITVTVDVTEEGTHVIAVSEYPNNIKTVIYSKFHPLVKQQKSVEQTRRPLTDDEINKCDMCGYVGKDKDSIGQCPKCRWDELRPLVEKARQKPLTDDQIYDMYNEPRSDAEMLEFARAIEATHGIKE